MSEIFDEEKKYLDYTKRELKREEDFYEKELKEIPRRYTKALQGDSFLVESLMTVAATKLRKLQMSEKIPYFGRIDFLSSENKNVLKIYIGKTTIVDEKNNSVTTDWRAPICSLYYDSDVGLVNYEAPVGIVNGELKLKRQIIIKDGELIDVLNTNSVSEDELLQPYLSVNADGKMKTIIASIQKEQNQIIRKTISKNIIVQGVAGSGKTSVALHRVAYLVYNLGEAIRTNQILVIGPNKYFLNYISSILPELEIDPVDQKTYLELLNDILKEKYLLSSGNSTSNKKTNKKNIERINSYKCSLEFKNALEKFINDYINTRRINTGIVIDGEEIYSAEMINDLLYGEKKGLPNYAKVSNHIMEKYKEDMEKIYTRLNEKYRQIYIKLPKDDPIRNETIEKSNALDKLIKENGIKIIKDYFKKIEVKPLDIYKMFIEQSEKYILTLSNEEIAMLRNNTLTALNKKKISFEDLPSLMYINYLLTGSNKQYKYIVIDEAQDYGIFHILALKYMFPDSTFSIYGDLAQSIYPYRGIKKWEDLVSDVFAGNCEITKLNKSYRTTIEITNNANKVLDQLNIEKANPVIRNGKEVSFLEYSQNNEYKLKKISEWLDNGYKSIAIICKTDKEATNLVKELDTIGIKIKQILNSDEKYDGGLFVITSVLAKGLEFDCVMINDASSNVYDNNSEIDMHLLYVACTRALHELCILYNNKLCNVFTSNNEKTKERKLIKQPY